MTSRIIRFVPFLLFVVTGLMALAQERDYWEAGSWFSFAIAVLIFALKPANAPGHKNARLLAFFFMALGILLLVLRITGILPEPIRPLSV